jgi:hypothetical protein
MTRPWRNAYRDPASPTRADRTPPPGSANGPAPARGEPVPDAGPTTDTFEAIFGGGPRPDAGTTTSWPRSAIRPTSAPDDRSARPGSVRLERIGDSLLASADDMIDTKGPAAVARSLPFELNRLAVVLAGPVDAMLPELADQLGRWVTAGWESVRLVGSAIAASDGGPSASQILADQLGVEVVAPDGQLLVVPDGSLFVVGGSGLGSGAWWRCRPGRAPMATGARFPAPPWQHELAPVADPDLPDIVLEEIPAGLWVHRPGVADLNDLAYAMPLDERAVALLVSRPGETPLPADELMQLISRFPRTVQENLLAVPYGDDPVADAELGAVAAIAAEGAVRVSTGLTLQVSRRRRRVFAVNDDGKPTWRPFVPDLVHYPYDGAAEPLVWAEPFPNLAPIGPAQFELTRNWTVELIGAGLWVRPTARSAGADLVRSLPAAAQHCTVLVGIPGNVRYRPPWRAIRRLLRELPSDARRLLRLAVPEDRQDRLALAAAKACGPELSGEPVCVLDGEGTLVPRCVALPAGPVQALLGRGGPIVRIDPPPPTRRESAPQPPVRPDRTSPAGPTDDVDEDRDLAPALQNRGQVQTSDARPRRRVDRKQGAAPPRPTPRPTPTPTPPRPTPTPLWSGRPQRPVPRPPADLPAAAGGVVAAQQPTAGSDSDTTGFDEIVRRPGRHRAPDTAVPPPASSRLADTVQPAASSDPEPARRPFTESD